jgi:hypothetical protein
MPQVPRNVDIVTLTHLHGGSTAREGSHEFNPPGAFASWEDHERMLDRSPTAVDLLRYRQDEAQALSQPDAYLGTYREPAGVRQRSPERTGDETYLDVSRRFVGPRRVEEARKFGREQNQVSIFDTDEKLKYVHENPAVPTDDKYPYSASMAGAARTQRYARELPPGPMRTAQVESMVDDIEAAQSLKDPLTAKAIGDEEDIAKSEQWAAIKSPPGARRTAHVEAMVDAIQNAQKLGY